MSSFAQEPPPNNLTGALIFTAYVASALLLTGFLISNHSAKYQKHSKKRDHRHERHLQIFAALSVLSFSTLSYHMLSYLIVSYRAWATQNGYRLPRQLFGERGMLGTHDQQRVPLHIWSWLTGSTLFQDFAMTICGNSARFWWTQQALLATMAWSVYMSFEGRRREIPHLWAYAFVSQILPVSFAQNLFFLDVLLTPASKPEEVIWIANPMLQLASLAAYYAFVGLAPYVAGTDVFISVVITIRLLLFCPLFLPMVLPNKFVRTYLKARDAQAAYRGTYQFIGICSIVLFGLQTAVALFANGFEISSILGAIHDDPAVSALGYDYVLSLVSAVLWASVVGSDLF